MIQKLFFFTGLLFISNVNAQVLSSYGDNFEALSLGDIQDQGIAPHTWHHNGGVDALPFFQVENSPEHGKVMAISGPSGSDAWLYTSASKNIWRNSFGAAWTTRTEGNDMVVVEFDFNPGAASMSQNNFSVEIMGNNDTPVAGITIGKNGLGINGSTGENKCHVMYASTIPPGTPSNGNDLNNIIVGNSGYGPYVAKFTDPIEYRPLFVDDYNGLLNDTWVRIAISYDFSAAGADSYFDGKFRAMIPQGTGGGIARPYSTYWNPCTAMEEPTEVDFFAYTGPENTESATAYFDNIVVRAAKSTGDRTDDSLLSVESRTRSVLVSTYPNPTTDVINIYNSNNLRLSKYELRDIKGSVMKSGSLKNIQDQKINVSDLSAGIYFLNMNTEDNSTVTKKIIKQ